MANKKRKPRKPEDVSPFYYQVTVPVPVPYMLHQNEEPEDLAHAAYVLLMKHEGGGMTLGGDTYDHHYIHVDEEWAREFADKARALGYSPRLLRYATN